LLIQKLEIDKANSEREAKLALMSDSEKRAYAADTRASKLSGKCEKCSDCGADLTMVPFFRLNYKYCSVACVQAHMKKIEAK